MTPKILEYNKDTGRITITPEAFIIPEVNSIITKHKDPYSYLGYIYLMSSVDSPYINLPDEEKSDVIQYDVTETIGEFDVNDELLQPAIDRLSKLWESKAKRYYESLGIGMDKVAEHLRNVEVTSGGKDSNLSEINRMIKEAGHTIKSYREVERQVDEELKTKMRGKSTLGDY